MTTTALIRITAEGPVPSLADFQSLYASDVRAVEISASTDILILPHHASGSERHLGWLHGLLGVMLDYGFTSIAVEAIEDDGTATLVAASYSIASSADTLALLAHLLSLGSSGVFLR